MTVDRFRAETDDGLTEVEVEYVDDLVEITVDFTGSGHREHDEHTLVVPMEVALIVAQGIVAVIR